MFITFVNDVPDVLDWFSLIEKIEEKFICFVVGSNESFVCHEQSDCF